MLYFLEKSVNPSYEQAQPWSISQWLNTVTPISLESLRGKVTVLHAFQMLCPGCVSHGIPQAKLIHTAFPSDKVQVIGLHSVFEHHEAMTPVALQAFVHEYRLGFPIGIDQADPADPIPLTMRAYRLQGTPSLILIDKAGYIRLHHFGQIDDLRVGAVIGQLLTE
ncbi:redoxin domain-containing protein [Paralcaligenes ginsengisoli]